MVIVIAMVVVCSNWSILLVYMLLKFWSLISNWLHSYCTVVECSFLFSFGYGETRRKVCISVLFSNRHTHTHTRNTYECEHTANETVHALHAMSTLFGGSLFFTTHNIRFMVLFDMYNIVLYALSFHHSMSSCFVCCAMCLCVVYSIFWIMRFYFFHFIFHSILVFRVCMRFFRVGFLRCHVWSLKCLNSNKPKCIEGIHFSSAYRRWRRNEREREREREKKGIKQRAAHEELWLSHIQTRQPTFHLGETNWLRRIRKTLCVHTLYTRSLTNLCAAFCTLRILNIVWIRMVFLRWNMFVWCVQFFVIVVYFWNCCRCRCCYWCCWSIFLDGA